MKQTIEIEVPDGMNAIWKDGKVVFEDIKSQLPKTWKEFCKNYPINSGEFIIGLSSQIGSPRWGDRDINIDRNVLPNYKAGEAHLALMQLHQLRDCYRQGWIPDDNHDNYLILNNRGKYNISVNNWTSHFLTFQDRDRAEEFLTNFRDLIEPAGDLI